jgi:CYTH domain-containing protein
MDRKIVEYKIVIESQEKILAKNVSEHIKKWWQPFGTPIVDKYNYGMQAMVKYEEEKQSLDNEEEIHIKTWIGSGYTRDKEWYGVFYD